MVAGDGAARLFADQRVSLLFSPPCAFPCTFRLYELGVILSSPVNETISFAVQLCRYHQNVIVGRQRQLTGATHLGAPYVDCQSARSTPAYNISGVPSVVKLDLGGLYYSLWSPNPSVVTTTTLATTSDSVSFHCHFKRAAGGRESSSSSLRKAVTMR